MQLQPSLHPYVLKVGQHASASCRMCTASDRLQVALVQQRPLANCIISPFVSTAPHIIAEVEAALDGTPTKSHAAAAFREAADSGANIVPIFQRILSDHLTPVLAYRCLVKEDQRSASSFLFESVVNGDQQVGCCATANAPPNYNGLQTYARHSNQHPPQS